MLKKLGESLNAFYYHYFIYKNDRFPEDEEFNSLIETSKKTHSLITNFVPKNRDFNEMFSDGNCYLKNVEFMTTMVHSANMLPSELAGIHKRSIKFLPYMLMSKSFQIDSKILNLLMLTKSSVNNPRLPFLSVFLDTSIKIDNVQIQGICFREIGHIGDNFDIECHYFGWNYESNFIINDWFILKSNKSDYKKPLLERKIRKQLRILLKNFLNFLNDPSVSYTEIKPTEEQNIKRVKKGKAPLPIRAVIKISDTLKKYINSIDPTLNDVAYSHRFWVRGHFRTLKAERYGVNAGKKIWILPHIKGKGILVEKEYTLNQSKNESVVEVIA
ncbi:hypothetical protein K9M74_03275 [Candidatus Woesearchaeota archaeon]|nr:hypothetical protein [Candidatus Woesearchaeota archaeon]MCF8012817.1 hypothetical protein [Candidatus Woesearchaeota archaeon]